MAVQAIGYFLLLLCIENNVFVRVSAMLARLVRYQKKSQAVTTADISIVPLDAEVQCEEALIDQLREAERLIKELGSITYNELFHSASRKTSQLDDQYDTLEGMSEKNPMIARLSQFSVVLDRLRMVFTSRGLFSTQTKVALNGLSLGLKMGERFGLLGVNGAG